MDGAGRWFFQRISGIALLVFLLGHFWVTHYSPGGEVTYQKVALRLVQPEWKFFNLTFLVLGLSHGLNGMWAISEDYITREWLRMTLFGAVLMAGLCLLVFGTLNILAFQPKM
jgi:succinate dehydrogenase / fumarate reductase, membrane anchor subunit